jgi:hypothetical protein
MPRVALRFEPLQVALEFDMMVQPAKFPFGEPFVWKAVPLVSSANTQIGARMPAWAIARLVKLFCLAPPTVVSPWYPTT